MAAVRTKPVSAGDVPAVDKWQVLRDLATARQAYGLSDRDLGVLQALISFHPGADLGGASLVVHPSNRSICDRLNGMPNSTMRRHVARLVDAGIVVRRDSPNGKRYARRYGDEKIAYGFDLSPLARRAVEFRNAADQARADATRLKRLREEASLMRRDLEALAAEGRSLAPSAAPWDAYSDMAALTARALRRKLSADETAALRNRLSEALTEVKRALDLVENPGAETEELSTAPTENEQHIQSSKKDFKESEPGGSGALRVVTNAQRTQCEENVNDPGPQCPSSDSGPDLRTVLDRCNEVQAFHEGPIRSWADLVRAAGTLAPMMGIPISVWNEAVHDMGARQAATVVAAMLERFDRIHSPGGYLRSLSRKAAARQFNCGRMIAALKKRAA
ncbi:Plasmid replication initiation protein RepC2 (plasmid) [Marinibacterium anthonyi]|nr:Plasmid replication initiation protein RepC2 [Marinibacterium anthonyi]